MKVFVIGAGYAGLVSSALLAQQGYEVHLFDKNSMAGGRASVWHEAGFTFDKGPSWYWMPDVFDHIIERLGYRREEMYDLRKLDPSFSVFFGDDERMDVSGSYESLKAQFESIETGSAQSLDQFMKGAQEKYEAGIQDLARKPSLSWTEFAQPKVLQGLIRLNLLSSVASEVRKSFKDPRIRQIMEFPVLFLGQTAHKIPALYTMMNYAGLKLGTFYPMGGFASVSSTFYDMAISHGVKFHLNTEVTSIHTSGDRITSMEVDNKHVLTCDAILGTGDYVHMESLLPERHRNYSASYWKKKTFAPSSLIFYLGVDKKINGLQHHNLFFHSDMEEHTQAIYKNPAWPNDPLFYVCCPSKTDSSVAPEGKENMFILMPIAIHLEDHEYIRERYYLDIIRTIEEFTGESIDDHVEIKRSYCVSDFIKDYHSYGGNAYGLANTLTQTALFKPRIRNRSLTNMFYAGQLTVPGPGVPPSLMSGELVADYMIKQFTDA